MKTPRHFQDPPNRVRKQSRRGPGPSLPAWGGPQDGPKIVPALYNSQKEHNEKNPGVGCGFSAWTPMCNRKAPKPIPGGTPPQLGHSCLKSNQNPYTVLFTVLFIEDIQAFPGPKRAPQRGPKKRPQERPKLAPTALPRGPPLAQHCLAN